MSIFLLPKWVTRRLDLIRRSFLWHGHKQIHGSKKRIPLTSWALLTRTKELGGLGVRDLEQMNKSLLIKWMWQWVSTEHAWWKEATITLGTHIRSWEMTQISAFWLPFAKLAPMFNASIMFIMRQGNTTQFWHDDWLQGPLRDQFPQLYIQSRFIDVSVSQCMQQGEWTLFTQPNLAILAQQQLQQLLANL
jgi:hypothetical protein